MTFISRNREFKNCDNYRNLNQIWTKQNLLRAKNCSEVEVFDRLYKTNDGYYSDCCEIQDQGSKEIDILEPIFVIGHCKRLLRSNFKPCQGELLRRNAYFTRQYDSCHSFKFDCFHTCGCNCS